MQKRPDAVKFRGAPKTLIGPQLKAGDKAPDFACLTQGLEVVGLSKLPSDRPRLFSVVPSLDTPVCNTQTKKFEETLGAYKGRLACYTISLDLPFAQKRFCGVENIDSMTTLSDVHNHSFGKSWGTLLEGLPLPLLCRAVFVVDKNGKITYAEYVPEVTSEPNYAAALAALKAAAG